MDFKEKVGKKQNLINSRLNQLMDIKGAPIKIVEAMKYSLFAGGKRIRPILTLSICEALEGIYEDAVPFACAIEMIHTYSLIHDDLPAMDNDTLRRGKPTNHVVFGDATAILAGDGLLNYAFEVMLKAVIESDMKKSYVKASEIIAKAAGVLGMIGGQVMDIQGEDKLMGLDELYSMHKKKTGALIEASCMTGCVISGKEEKLELVSQYSKNLGIAFQIVDDILDYEGDVLLLGKTTGKDKAEGKATFVNILGIEESKLLSKKYSMEACKMAEEIDKSGFLRELTLYLFNRKH